VFYLGVWDFSDQISLEKFQLCVIEHAKPFLMCFLLIHQYLVILGFAVQYLCHNVTGTFEEPTAVAHPCCIWVGINERM